MCIPLSATNDSAQEHTPRCLQEFQEVYHVTRRSTQYWDDLSNDLVIEHTLNKSFKSTGGLTHGNKMTEEQRNMSFSVMCEINVCMQEFNGLSYITRYRSD